MPSSSHGTFYVGVSIASVTHLARPGADLYGAVAEVALAVDRSGADLLCVPDHVMQMDIGGGPRAPMLEAYTLLGGLAAATSRVNLGAFVSPVTLRNPALLAKAVTTLDVMSRGRAVLGLGAGVSAAEHAAYGYDFPRLTDRVRRVADALVICREMFGRAESTAHLETHSVTAAVNVPRPVRERVPILVGGGGERLTLPLVARYADLWNAPPGAPDDLRRKLGILDSLCDQCGRDPAEIVRTAFLLQPESADGLRRSVAGVAELGFNGVIIAASHLTPDAVTAWLAAIDAELGRQPNNGGMS